MPGDGIIIAVGRVLLSHSASINVSMTSVESDTSALTFSRISSGRPTSVPVEMPTHK